MKPEQLIKISRNLSKWLRHKPEDIGITIGDGGWVEISDLIAKAKPKFEITLEDIKTVVKDNDKQRFSLSEDFKKIKANQGHSFKVKIDFEKVVPPVILYHGTVEDFIPSIMKTGLTKQRRHHVHLSANIDTAKKVGSRRGKPVILEVDCKSMLKDGFQFYKSENGVYLIDEVPPKYLKKKV